MNALLLVLGIGSVVFAGMLVYTAYMAYKKVGSLRFLFILTAFAVFLISGATVVISAATGWFRDGLMNMVIVYQFVSFGLLYYGLLKV